jgi:hypothetical protein
LAEVPEKPSPLLPSLPHLPNHICILEQPEELASGKPSDAAVAKLLNDFSEQRRSRIRLRVLQGVAFLLATLTLAAAAFAVLFRQESLRRVDLLKEASAGDYSHAINLLRANELPQSLVHLARSLLYNAENREASSVLRTLILRSGSFPPPVTGCEIGGPLQGFSLSPDGGRAVATWKDGRVVCYRVSTAGLQEAFRFQQTYAAWSTAFSADGRWLAITSPGGVVIHSADNGSILGPLASESNYARSVAAVAWHPREARLLVAQNPLMDMTGAGEIVEWQIGFRAVQVEKTELQGPVKTVAWATDGKSWFAGGAHPDARPPCWR